MFSCKSILNSEESLKLKKFSIFVILLPFSLYYRAFFMSVKAFLSLLGNKLDLKVIMR